MVDQQDWDVILNSSEVFREYVKNEISNESAAKLSYADELENKLDEELEVYAKLEEFQTKVNSNPALRDYFIKCKAAIEQDPTLRNKIDKNFLQGIDMLDLSVEE